MKTLRRVKQKLCSMHMHGIDIETYDKNRKLLMTSIYNAKGYDQVFIRNKKLIYVLKHDISFKNSILVATNLGFDFFGIFYNHKEKGQFNTLFRGSSLISAKTKILNNEFIYNTKNRQARTLKFLDTMNFSPIGVKKAGELLKLPKLDMAEIIGQKPADSSEWYNMIMYNLRDSEISSKFMLFLKDSFEFLGATFKDTIASTAMSLFKSKYLKHQYFRHDEDILLEIIQAYYGGRCEIFKRGTTDKLNYFDFNSLYPSVMHDFEYPDPNTMHISFEQSCDKIMKYEGCSHVIIECPNINYPLLPTRYEDKFGKKVIFPVGIIEGWYTHVELRKAISIGYHVITVKKSIYYTHTCSPFKDYVSDLYQKRLFYMSEKNPMENVCKLLMNSLYGKFAQKFIDIENSIPVDLITEEFLKKNDILEILGDYARYKQAYSVPPAFCIPIWSAYVTAYGRLKLYELLIKHDPYYCDTDSIMTVDNIETSNELGKLKLEMEIMESVLVKPKFYAVFGHKQGQEVEEVKIKGFSRALSYLEIAGERLNLKDRKRKFLTYLEFKGFLLTPKAKYNKFVKFKEALRRHLIPNEEILIEKSFKIEDDKRMWSGKFKMNDIQVSRPVIVSNIRHTD